MKKTADRSATAVPHDQQTIHGQMSNPALDSFLLSLLYTHTYAHIHTGRGPALERMISKYHLPMVN